MWRQDSWYVARVEVFRIDRKRGELFPSLNYVGTQPTPTNQGAEKTKTIKNPQCEIYNGKLKIALRYGIQKQ